MQRRPKVHPQGVQPEHFGTLIGDDNSTRRKGLGNLEKLPDDIILGILGLLDPEQLAKLTTVSKAFYCFASHEDLWKAIVLQFEDDVAWTYCKTWKLTYAKAMHHDIRIDCNQNPIQVKHFYSDLLYQPWLCATLDIDESWTIAENIDRRSNLSLEEFRSEYEGPNKPVIITDVVQSWVAYEEWDRDTFREAFKNTPVIVGDAPMNFDAYLAYCEDQQDEIPLYLFDKHFCDKSSRLGEEYSVPEYFKEDLFSVLGKDRPDYRWLIYGPYKSGSTFHKDPNATSAWNAVIFGSKKWIMYPPNVLPPGVRQSDDGADVASPVSLMEWMLSFYDLRDCEGVQPYECVLKRGEILFVPRGWWHMAVNLEETCAITQNYVSRANLRHVLNFLKSPHANVLVSGVETYDDKITLHDRFYRALQSQYPELVASIDAASRKRCQQSNIEGQLKRCFPKTKSEHSVNMSGIEEKSFSFQFF